MRIGSTASKLLTVVISSALLLFSISMADPQITKTYNEETKTIILSQYGSTISEFRLIYNTDECLINCEAVILINLYQPLTLPSVSNGNFDLFYTKDSEYYPGLESLEIKIFNFTYTNKTTHHTYSCGNIEKTDSNGTSFLEEQCIMIPAKSELFKQENLISSDLFSGLTLPPGEYVFRIFGRKLIESKNVDWKVKISGHVFDEWDWWNDNWRKKVPLNFSGTGTSDHQIFVNLTYNSMKPDFSDIRVLNGSENQELPFWIENFTANGYADIWIKGNFTTSNSTQVYIYYNNSAAASASNGNSTFIFFDDFNGVSIDTQKWAVVGTVHIGTINGSRVAVISEENATETSINSTTSITRPAVVVTRMSYDGYKVDTTNCGRWGVDANRGLDNGTVNRIVWCENKNGTPIPDNCAAGTCSNSAANTKVPRNKFQMWKLNYSSSASTVIVNTTTIFTFTNNIPSASLGLMFRRRGSGSDNEGKWYPDYVYVRKYNLSDIKASVGLEHEAPMQSANETEGDSAITQGIINALGSSLPIYSNQLIYFRNQTNNQTSGIFDKVTQNGTKRWAFNYVSTGESFVNMQNITPVFYTRELTNLPSSNITLIVELFINGTK